MLDADKIESRRRRRILRQLRQRGGMTINELKTCMRCGKRERHTLETQQGLCDACINALHDEGEN